jgi:hypothetical protein
MNRCRGSPYVNVVAMLSMECVHERCGEVVYACQNVGAGQGEVYVCP